MLRGYNRGLDICLNSCIMVPINSESELKMPLSRKERKILIDVLVDNDIAMPEIPEDFLRKGFRGYNNYTDRALIREANSRGEDYKDLISQAMLRKSNSSS